MSRGMHQDPIRQDERRIVLIGKTGVGKSAAGNTILREDAFESELSPSSLTAKCQKVTRNIDGRRVAVIDTPGLFDTKLSKEEVLNEIKLCISMSAPGPHAFLVVLQPGRFTQEEKDTVEMIQTTFGKEAANYSMILFTHGDRLKKKTIKDFISQSPDLSNIVQQCHDRYHVFNNEITDSEQTGQLMDKIENMVKGNGGGYYTNKMFQRAEVAIEKKKQLLLEEAAEQKKKELDELRAKFEEERYHREESQVNMKYEQIARAQAERSNEFISAPAVVAGAATGAVSGATAGGYIGTAFGPAGTAAGAAVGAAAGAVVGAVVGVVTSVVVNLSNKCNVQ